MLVSKEIYMRDEAFQEMTLARITAKAPGARFHASHACVIHERDCQHAQSLRWQAACCCCSCMCVPRAFARCALYILHCCVCVCVCVCVHVHVCVHVCVCVCVHVCVFVCVRVYACGVRVRVTG